MTPTEKLSELAIDLPSPPAAAGLYKPVLVENGLIYFSGHLPIRHDGTMITGKVGDELTVEDGKAASVRSASISSPPLKKSWEHWIECPRW